MTDLDQDIPTVAHSTHGREYIWLCFSSGAPNGNIVQNHLNIALLNAFYYLNGRYRLFLKSPKNFLSVRIS